MRVTQKKLIDLAREEAERRGQTEHVLSGYLIGSVASGNPIIAGSADIDLVLIHRYEPARSREIVPLSSDIHLDILHHSQEIYRYPPDLRIDPWLGPSMCEPLFLYDPDHFFERAQAGVRGQFYRSDYTLARSMTFLQRARDAKPEISNGPTWVCQYITSALDGVNALATLGGFPIAGRRIFSLLKTRLTELNYEESWIGFQNLMSDSTNQEELVAGWLNSWEHAFDAASHHDPLFHPTRKNYFLKCFLGFIDMGVANEIYWVLIPNWSKAIQVLLEIEAGEPYLPMWESALEHFQLSSEHRIRRNDELENFLDHVEEIIENWD